MTTVEIHLDELYGPNHNFIITSSIWGTPNNVQEFNLESNTIIERNRKLLGKDFKTFHAKSLTAKNWQNLSPAYLDFLNLLFKYIHNKKLDLLIFLESREKRKKNSEILKQCLKTALEDTSNDLGYIFHLVPRNDLPAIYHRMDNIYNYLLHRDQYGGSNNRFYYYPDSKGKILRYHNKKISLCEKRPYGTRIYTRDFFEVIAVLTNKLMIFSEQVLGWRKPNRQIMAKFSPTDDADSRLIQACDVTANFLLAFIRTELGINDINSELKSNFIKGQNYFFETKISFMKFFGLKNGKVFCKDQNLKHCLRLDQTAD